jgi:hypothetical protein
VFLVLTHLCHNSPPSLAPHIRNAAPRDGSSCAFPALTLGSCWILATNSRPREGIYYMRLSDECSYPPRDLILAPVWTQETSPGLEREIVLFCLYHFHCIQPRRLGNRSPFHCLTCRTWSLSSYLSQSMTSCCPFPSPPCHNAKDAILRYMQHLN